MPNAPSSFNGGTETTAAAYDAQGNPLFYVLRTANLTVYTPDNISLGSLGGVTTPSGDAFSLVMGEVAVVPIPGVCRAYYLFYTLGGSFGGAVCYARVNCPVGSAPVIQTYSTILDLTYRSHTAIAVSKVRADGTRILYDVSDTGAHYVTLSVGGGFSAVVRSSISLGAGNVDWELDLSPDGAKMAWTMSTSAPLSSNVYVLNILASGDLDMNSK